MSRSFDAVLLIVQGNSRSRHFEAIIEALILENTNVVLLTLDPVGPINEWATGLNLPNLASYSRNSLREIHQFLIENQSSCITFATGHKPIISAWIISLFYRIPYAFSYSHQPNFFALMQKSTDISRRLKGRVHGLLERAYTRKARWIHSSSHESHVRLGALGITEDRIRHLPFGVNFSEHGSESHRPCSCSLYPQKLKNRKLIVSIGRLAPEKDHELIIDAFGILQKSNSEFSLVILGEGPNRVSLEKRVMEMDLGGKVFLPGNMPHTAYTLEAATVFVHAAQTESYGAVLIEARLHNLPIVSSPCGVALDMAQCGDPYVMLVATRDPADWARALEVASFSTPSEEWSRPQLIYSDHDTEVVCKELARYLLFPKPRH